MAKNTRNTGVSSNNELIDTDNALLTGKGDSGGSLKRIHNLPNSVRSTVAGFILLNQVAVAVPAFADDTTPKGKDPSSLADGLTIQRGAKIEGTVDSYEVQGGKTEILFNEGKGILGMGATYSSNVGMLMDGMMGHMIGKNTAVAIEVEVGSEQSRYLTTLGYKINKNQRVKLTYEHFEQLLDFTFKSGTESARMGQDSIGTAYQIKLDKEFLKDLEMKGYFTQAQSKELESKDVVSDGATLYEIYRNERRIAGGQKIGGDIALGFTPWKGGKMKLAVNYEQIKFELKNETENKDTSGIGGEIKLSQQFLDNFALEMGVSTNSTEKYVAGIGMNQQVLNNLKVYMDGQYLERRAGIGGDKTNETRVGAGLTWTFGSDKQMKHSTGTKKETTNETTDELPERSKYQSNEFLNWVKDPVVRSNSVVAVIDESYKRVADIDKTALPAEASIDKTNGNILVDVVPFTGINSITKDGTAFTNNNNFSVSGSRLTIKTSSLMEPAVGTTNTYLTKINEVGGGQTVVNMIVAHGSVSVTSLTITRIAAITDNTTSLSAPILGSQTNSAITINNSTTSFTDTDGIQNTVIQLSTSSGFGTIAQTLTGLTGGTFSGLTGNTTYYIRISGEAKNATTGLFETKTTPTLVVTTSVGDTTPTAFTFIDVAGVALSTVQTSAAITVSGINAPTPISVTGGSYSINGGATTSAPGFVNNGDQVMAIHTSAGTYSTAVNTTITIGGISDTFTTMTLAAVIPTPTLTFSPDNDGTPDHDLISIDETLTAITFHIQTPSSGGNDVSAQVLVQVTNGGKLEVNGTSYTDGQYFTVSDIFTGQGTGPNQSGTIRLLKSDDTEVWSKTFTGTGL